METHNKCHTCVINYNYFTININLFRQSEVYPFDEIACGVTYDLRSEYVYAVYADYKRLMKKLEIALMTVDNLFKMLRDPTDLLDICWH